MRKVALITGSSRGIGRNIALKLALNNYDIVIAAKSIQENKLSGTIYEVKNEIKENYNVDVLAVPLDVRETDQMKNCVAKIQEKFGRLDVLINNAGALWWKSIKDTPKSKYELINGINVKASLLLSKYCIPLMNKNNYGHIIMHSPPLTDINMMETYHNKTAYMISKYGMTMAALGIASEYKDTNIAANSIWPSTAIESEAVKQNNLGTKHVWRKPDIISDAIVKILQENPKTFTGNQLIDEEYLKSKGVTNFDKYQCISGFEPPKLKDLFLMQ